MSDSPVDYLTQHEILRTIASLSWENHIASDEPGTKMVSKGQWQADICLFFVTTPDMLVSPLILPPRSGDSGSGDWSVDHAGKSGWSA
jgi:hypothetical protein